MMRQLATNSMVMNLEKLNDMLLKDRPSEEILKNEAELFEFIPELKACKGFEQNNEWHVYDVYGHILHVLDNVPSNLILRMTALFHDIGKPQTYFMDEKGIGHFYGHWVASQRIFEEFATKHEMDREETKKISDLIYYHDINISVMKPANKRKVYNLFGSEGIKMLYTFKRADLLAQNSKFHYLLKDYDEQEKEFLLRFEGSESGGRD